MTKIPKEYIAGLFDGEGYLGIHQDHNHLDIRVIIGMTKHAGVLNNLKDMYGGGLTIVKKVNPKHNDCTYWEIKGLACEKLLIDIKPYVIIKRKQIDVALKLRKTKFRTNTRYIPDSVLKLRVCLAEELKLLNSRKKIINNK